MQPGYLALVEMQVLYQSEFMHHQLSSLNDGKSEADCVKEFNLKDMIWALATAWNRVTPPTLRNAWQNLYSRLRPSLMFEDIPNASNEFDFSGFSLSQQKTGAGLVTKMGEDLVTAWMDVDKDALVVNMMTDKIIVEMARKGNTKGDTSQDDSTGEKEEGESQDLILFNKMTDFARTFIEGLKQRHIFTEQKLMTVDMMLEEQIREK